MFNEEILASTFARLVLLDSLSEGGVVCFISFHFSLFRKNKNKKQCDTAYKNKETKPSVYKVS